MTGCTMSESEARPEYRKEGRKEGSYLRHRYIYVYDEHMHANTTK